jgi:hypothetical protein
MKALMLGLAVTVAAWSAAAQEVTRDAMREAIVLPNGRCMIVATTPKTVQGTIVIPFGMNFKTAPSVLVSSDWIGSDRGIGATETVTAISIDQFSDTSAAASGSYFVSWTAVGRASVKACK